MNRSKVVVVTGAVQDIGAAIVKAFRKLADAIVFLDSAPFITGEILPVDGGQSAGH